MRDVYEQIRKGKFRVPTKIKNTENLLEKNNCVINWWCRQSGKTLTSIKIARDAALKKPGTKIFLIAVNENSARLFVDHFTMTINFNIITRKTNSEVELKNGSSLEAISSSQVLLPRKDKSYNLIIVDEFEFLSRPRDVIFRVQEEFLPVVPKSWLSGLWPFRNRTSKAPDTKVLFNSSRKNGEVLKMLTDSFPKAFVNKLNWDKTPFSKEDLIERIGPEAFKIEYDSYQ